MQRSRHLIFAVVALYVPSHGRRHAHLLALHALPFYETGADEAKSTERSGNIKCLV